MFVRIFLRCFVLLANNKRWVYTNQTSEDTHQAMFVEWFGLQYKGVLIFAIPNGSSRGDTQRSRSIRGFRLKLSGVVPGVWDLCVPGWMLWIEMKKNSKCYLTKEQKVFRDYVEPFGYTCIVGKGFDDVVKKVEEFTKDRKGLRGGFCY